MIIDCHQHANCMGWNVDKLVAHFDALGVDKAWLLTWELTNGLTLLYQHISAWEMWEACKKHPKRFIPFYAPDPTRPDAEQVLRAAIKKGLKGFGECKVPVCLDHPDLVRLFRIAADDGLPILLHLDKPLPQPKDMPPEYWYCHSMDTLGEILEMLPHANFIGHGPGFWRYISGDEPAATNAYPTGKVKPDGKIVQYLNKYKNLYCDLSAGSGLNGISRDPEWGKRFLVKYHKRLLYGTDSYDRDLMNYLNGLKLDKSVMTRIMGQNALTLLPQ
jgi:predicted TIM-barrel fold metal-dependent hydrolase